MTIFLMVASALLVGLGIAGKERDAIPIMALAWGLMILSWLTKA